VAKEATVVEEKVKVEPVSPQPTPEKEAAAPPPVSAPAPAPVSSPAPVSAPAPTANQKSEPATQQPTEKDHEPRLGPRPRSHNKVLNPPGGKSSVVFY